ncbi:MAG: YggS family pyridoxal phosphate-dependent enzyme, partial [Perlabentimonas sp.]
PFVSLIHSVDSFKLLKEINKQAKKQERIIPCLLQMHIAEEDTKFGLDKEELSEILESEQFRTFGNVQVVGLMGMATFTDDTDQVKREFRGLKKLFDDVKKKYFPSNSNFTFLSMGMSGDYNLAVTEGSNMVRVGSRIFGARNYGTN